MPEENTIPNGNDHNEKEPGWIPDPSPSFEQSSNPVKASDSAEVEINNMNPAQTSNPIKNENQSVTPASISPSEERTWAMLAHFSVLLNLITGFLGGIAAIIIYFVYKDRSRLVAYHAMQSFIFQSITWIGAGTLAGLFIGFGSALAFLIIPLLCLVPGFLFLLLIPISLIYGFIGGVKVNNGEDFRYWQVGDWVREILEPKPIQ